MASKPPAMALSLHPPCALPLLCTAGLHVRAAGWVRREHRGAVSGINYSLCSQENADGLSTAGECLASGKKQGTGLVEVVTEVTALRQPIASELYVRNYRKQWYCEDNTSAETQKSKSNDGLSCGIMRTTVSLFTVMDVCI